MKKSFGLIEVVISVGIITMFLGALLALSVAGTRLTVSSQRNLQAANLAREAMEKIRLIRDNYWLDGRTNLNVLQVNGERGYWLNGNRLRALNNGEFNLIDVQNSLSSLDTLGSLEPQEYARKIVITEPAKDKDGKPDHNIKKVTVEIQWQKEKGSRYESLKMISLFTNWRNQ